MYIRLSYNKTSMLTMNGLVLSRKLHSYILTIPHSRGQEKEPGKYLYY